MRRTGLPRGTTELRRSELKRASSRMNRRQVKPKVSERRKAYAAELDAITPALIERSQGICEARIPDVCTLRARERHHVLKREFGPNTLANLRHLCRDCHQWVTDMVDRDEAEERGLWVSALGKVTPHG